MVKRLAFLAGFLVVAAVAAQLLLPAAVSDFAGDAVGSLTQARAAKARIETFPAAAMALGRFDRIWAEAEGAQIDKLTFDTLELAMTDARLDMKALLLERRFALQAAKEVTLRAAVSEKTLASLINRTVKGVKNTQVRITPERVSVKSQVTFGNFLQAAVRVEGKLRVADGQIVFLTEEVVLDHRGLGKFGASLFTDLALTDLNALPFNVTVKDIVLEEGRAVLYANNREI